MLKTLDQNEIDALFKASQTSRNAPGAAPAKKVVPCDLRLANRLTADQLVAVTSLHEAFARRLSSSLAAHLRVAFDLTLVSAEQMTFREFTRRLSDLTYFASLHVMPIDARAAIQCDLTLAYPIIDVVLGGTGMDSIDMRDLTEIEEQILETVVRLIVQDLRTTWAPVIELDFQFEQRQRGVQLQSTMVPEDKILCLSFEGRLSNASGSLAMVFPAVIADALLRRLSVQSSYTKRMPSRELRRRMRERLLDSRFIADLSLPSSPLAVRQLVDLEPGSVLMLSKRTQEPIHLNIAGKPMFLAYPVRQGTRRGAKIEKRLSILSTNAKESA
jgi:flagellar motor switch protein FliM